MEVYLSSCDAEKRRRLNFLLIIVFYHEIIHYFFISSKKSTYYCLFKKEFDLHGKIYIINEYRETKAQKLTINSQLLLGYNCP